MTTGKSHAPAISPPRPLTGHPVYEWIKDLSSGSFGFVQLARSKKPDVTPGVDDLVAIKFIERGDRVNRYVEAEVFNHRLLRHPHVIEFKEVFLTTDYICIAMEYACGGDLFSYVKGLGRLQEMPARCLFQQLILGLDYCHRMGVVNRDIKLENTLLQLIPGQRLPLLKICDFGYSKAHHMSAPKSRVGTLAYIAPEVVTAQGNYDGRMADLWSCGVMLYIMLFGKYPFENAATAAAANAAAAAKTAADKAAAAAAAATAARGGTPEARAAAAAAAAAAAQPPSTMANILRTQWRWSLPRDVEISHECTDVLRRLLVADPASRLTMEELLQHPWFMANLPPRALAMNDHFIGSADYGGVQSTEDIKQVLEAARNRGPLGGGQEPGEEGGESEGGDEEDYGDIDDAIDDEKAQGSF